MSIMFVASFQAHANAALNNTVKYILEKDEFDPINLHPNIELSLYCCYCAKPGSC